MNTAGRSSTHLRAYPGRQLSRQSPYLGDDQEEWIEEDTSARPGRRLAPVGRALGQDGAAAAAPPAAPAGLPQPAGARPGRDGRNLLRAADRMSVECAARDGHLLVLLGPSPVSGMGGGRGLCSVLA